jgi:hypothetical protein
MQPAGAVRTSGRSKQLHLALARFTRLHSASVPAGRVRKRDHLVAAVKQTSSPAASRCILNQTTVSKTYDPASRTEKRRSVGRKVRPLALRGNNARAFVERHFFDH